MENYNLDWNDEDLDYDDDGLVDGGAGSLYNRPHLVIRVATASNVNLFVLILLIFF